MNDGFDIKKVFQNGDGLTPEQIIFEWQQWNEDLESQIQWLSLLFESGGKLKDGKLAAIEFETFFTKLNGLITEAKIFLQHHFLSVEMIERLRQQYPDFNINEEHEKFSKMFSYLADQFECMFSDKEKRVILFLRDKACHFVTKGYTISYAKDGKSIPKRDGKLKSEFQKEILSDLQSLGGATKFAVDLFERIERPLLQFRGGLIWYADCVGKKLVATIRN